MFRFPFQTLHRMCFRVNPIAFGLFFALVTLPLTIIAAQSTSEQANADPVDFTPLVTEQNRLSIDFLRRLSKEDDKNVFCSPVNIHMALALLESGSRGKTREEFQSLLYRDANVSTLYRPFIEMMNDQDQMGADIKMASHLWLRAGLELRPDYAASLTSRFAGFSQLDFKHQQNESIRAINDWVSNSTNELIRDLASRETVDAETLMFLASAIHFKGSWANAFSEHATRPCPFVLMDGKTTDVPMMRKQMGMQTVAGDGLTLGILPYGKETQRVEMVILLPTANDGLATMLEQLDVETLNGLLSKAKRKHATIVTLPKFELNTNYNLIPHLSKMGLSNAFTDGADFSGLTHDERIKLSTVIHKAVIKVDEEGTVAAAVTGIGGVRATSVQPPPALFNVDHPFAFLIRDRQSGSILFVGRVTDPTKKD
ncbi:serpin family protein [Novipirellula artificiosorum]|uniref:Serpin (Serine protease inhibitor) n=1 Tax=Novipirellula artificiosorum TaxID=2528016 RepID=A0A5C6E0B0_9BACT|nr:serpin family protein [Novipirellula artificiosorum]TWU42338.1 Serpin (serine protease inhibitor) [Novipirellula artificiosorum]